MKVLADKLQLSSPTFRFLGPIGTARLISYLSMRARKPLEIEQMAPAMIALWIAFQPELEPFVGRFDRLLRLLGEPPERVMYVADVLTVGT